MRLSTGGRVSVNPSSNGNQNVYRGRFTSFAGVMVHEENAVLHHFKYLRKFYPKKFAQYMQSSHSFSSLIHVHLVVACIPIPLCPIQFTHTCTSLRLEYPFITASDIVPWVDNLVLLCSYITLTDN